MKPADENDEEVTKIAAYAVEQINKRGLSNSIYVQGLVGVIKAQTQVTIKQIKLLYFNNKLL